MVLTEKYTTDKLIAADKTGKEALKIVISDDYYALGEIIEQLTLQLGRLGIIK